MDPVSLFAISMGATAIGSGVSAMASYTGGKANAAMMRYQAGIGDINARIAKQNADYTRAAGEVEAQQYGMKARNQFGKILVAQAGSGLDVNFGSAQEVQESQTEVARMDQRLIRNNAARKAWGYDVEAMKSTAEGNLYRAGADKSETAGKIGALTSILGGASSVSSKWMQANTLGLSLGGSTDTRTLDDRAYGG